MHRRSIAVVTGAALATLLAPPAHAHFKLNAPPAYSQQNGLGDPQKSAPCGQADPGNPVVPTNAVTTVVAGTTLQVKLSETIFHPGHYRVTIAKDLASLPADPPVVKGSTDCGSTEIVASPTLPILVDGALVHDKALSGEQTIDVPIPADMTCENCTLQVVQFMSNHGLNNPGGCFYHHCATVNVVAAGTPDAGPSTQPSVDAGDGEPVEGEGEGEGCACRVGPGRQAGTGGLVAGGALVALVAGLRRRRR
jgi:hypothetical protein